MKNNAPSIGWSDFARLNSTAEQGNSHSVLSESDVVQVVQENWNHRQPGFREKTLDRKVVVPVPASYYTPRFGFPAGTPLYRCTTALLREGMPVKARVTKRVGQDQEDFHVEKFITVQDARAGGFEAEEATFVKIVCYSAEALLENDGKRSGDTDWEIVCLIATPVREEPMNPGTMARNQLRLPGGTYTEYTGEDYAQAIAYWGRRIKIVG
jgi:hypothetical protein